MRSYVRSQAFALAMAIEGNNQTSLVYAQMGQGYSQAGQAFAQVGHEYAQVGHAYAQVGQACANSNAAIAAQLSQCFRHGDTRFDTPQNRRTDEEQTTKPLLDRRITSPCRPQLTEITVPKPYGTHPRDNNGL
jgi:hypothetical protein